MITKQFLSKNRAIINSKYFKKYINFIESKRNSYGYKKEIILENHHIHPKSLGGNNDLKNLIKLLPEDHYHAHYLLTKIFLKNTNEHYKMVCAWNLMNRVGKTPEFYKEERIKNIEYLKKYQSQYKIVKDINGQTFRVPKNFNRPGFVGITKGLTPVVNREGKRFLTSTDNPKLKTGEYKHHLKNRITVVNTKNESKMIEKKDYNRLKKYGYSRVKRNRGKWYHNIFNFENTMLILNELEQEIWSAFGWETGRGLRKFLWHPISNKYIQKSIKEIPFYIEQGWALKAPSKKIKKYWIYNPNTKEISKIIREDMEKYLNNGWIRGRGPNKKYRRKNEEINN